MAEVASVLRQIDGHLPVRIDDLSDLPPGIRDFANDHPGYELMQRPDDNDLSIPVRNAQDRIVNMKTWIDNVTERTPRVEVTKYKQWRESLLRGVAGGEIERNVARTFAANMGEWYGLSEAESASILRALRESAEEQERGVRGLSADSIWKAVDKAPGLSAERRALAKRGVADAVFDAYENEAALVGITPKLTGWVKKQGLAVGSNMLGWATDYLYPAIRFTKSPIFFLQEVPEAPFFLALMGRYPMANAVPDVAARLVEKVPLISRGGKRIREAKAQNRVWNDKTMVVMERMAKTFAQRRVRALCERADLARMGLTVSGQMTDPRSPLGSLLQRIGPGHERLYGLTTLQVRKQRTARRRGSTASTPTTCRASAPPSTTTWPAARPTSRSNTALHSNGDWRWVLIRGLAIRDARGKAYRVAGSLTDVTDRKLAEEELVRRALFDPLTGLSNRSLLEMRLRQVMARARREPDLRFAVLFLDLDRFKVVNDSLGHVVGDMLLIEFGRRLTACVRPSDTVARLGGDEFIILLEDIREDIDGSRVANRIHEVLAKPFILNGQEIFTTTSIGIATGSPDYRSVEDLLRDADAAMYRAKALGKCRSEIFDQVLHERALEVLQLETDLRFALDRGQFLLHYQPIICLADGSLRGFEALSAGVTPTAA